MLYRIAIYRTENGKRVFDRYATNEEMKLLRVNTKGKVEKLYTQREYLDIKDAPTLMWYNIMGDWQDVSDTHEVEWGLNFIKNKKPYAIFVHDILSLEEHEVDIYDTWTKKTYVVENAHQLFGLWSDCEGMADYVCMKIRIVGNIHEESK